MCGVLTRGPCWMPPNFGFFDHQMKVTVAETFLGGSRPPGPQSWGALPPPPKKKKSNHQTSRLKGLKRLRDILQLLFTTHSSIAPRITPTRLDCGRAETTSSSLTALSSKCSSVTIYIQNLTKLQDLMSHTLGHTFHGRIQPYNLTKRMTSICHKRHYLRQALYNGRLFFKQNCSVLPVHAVTDDVATGCGTKQLFGQLWILHILTNM